MKKKIILIEIISLIATLFILFVISAIYIFNNNYTSAKKSLISYSNIICEVFNGNNFSETKKIIDNENTIRLTIIDADGNVIIDTKLESLENHLDREELDKVGEFISRYSTSLNKNMLYYVQIDDGYYIRLSIPINSLNAFTKNYVFFGLISIIIILAISIGITTILYKKTLKPINKEINKLEYILGNKQTENQDFEMLSSKINELNNLLNDKLILIASEKEKNNFLLDNMNQGLIILNEFGKIEIINNYALKLFNVDLKLVYKKSYLYIFRDINVQELIKQTIINKTENQIIFEINNKKLLLYLSYNNENNQIILLIVDITLQENVNNMKREFFANASHELKSPLTSIIGYQQLINQGILTTKEEILDASSRTIKEALRMNKLIIEMLDLSRLENNIKSKIESVDVEKIINDLIEEFNQQIKNKKINIDIECENTILMANYSDIYKLIKNIIENAIIYNKDNGSIKIKLSNNKLTISDTGIGISNNDINHIFERFYRVDKARSKENSGTGLGLSIVKHICILYDYKINIDSDLGVGTKISIEFK